jgi:hypothetical protein
VDEALEPGNALGIPEDGAADGAAVDLAVRP